MEFSKWLLQNETWNNPIEKDNPDQIQTQNTPTADIGLHSPNPEIKTTPTTQRHNNRFQNINKRIIYGKGIEKQIFNSLIACGMKLREPSDNEDMYDKIDGWWNIGGKEEPIQIKYRDTGDDILFEVMKDYKNNISGRDMVGKAIYYAVLGKSSGQIIIVEVEEAKRKIKTAITAAKAEGFDDSGNYRTQEGLMLRIRRDPQSGQEKLMAYIPVSILRNVRPPCRANVSF